jgi:predicted DNA-binding protein (MmcQ/YjbR family)
VPEYADVPAEILGRLRSVCLALPDAYEERAWVGTRWRVRKKTFAHVLAIESDWPPAYARAAAAGGPVTVMTFRSAGPELDALHNAGHPFFRPQWGTNVVGIMLAGTIDWAEITELLTESYCVQAPKMLVDLISRPVD